MKAFIPIVALAIFSANPAFAACQDDIQPVKDRFLAVHDALSEQDHMNIEMTIGEAVSFCYADQEADAQTKIAEAKSLLGMN